MLREILTLYSEGISLQYYIMFEKNRTWFSFQPTFKNKAAPAFIIHVQDGSMSVEGTISPALEKGAKEKVREILSNQIFDQI